jgi:pimeloyl-ACP methyl ester carboxylesterase
LAGDAIFDSFYASQLQYQSNSTYTAILNNAAYIALLHNIGEPVILITHSQSGQFGWQLADTIPELIKGLVQIEPGSTPFETWIGPPFAEGYLPPFPPTPYGLSQLPLQYDPPIGHDPSLLKRQHVPPASPDLAPCILQAEPARKLVNIAKVPQLQIVSEASWHAVWDYCSAKYLKQAGCEVEFVPLESKGIHGNGHFSFMEKNNIEIAERVVLPWLEKVGE